MECDGTAEGLLKIVQKHCLMCGFVTASATLKPGNLSAAETIICLRKLSCAANSFRFHHSTRFFRSRKYVRRLDRVKALGSKGIKMHPDFQHFNLDEPNLFPAYRYCAEIGLPMRVHVGDITTDFSTPCRLYNLMDKTPGAHGHSRSSRRISGMGRGRQTSYRNTDVHRYFRCDQHSRSRPKDTRSARSGVTALKGFSSEAISRYVSRKASLNSLTHFRLRKVEKEWIGHRAAEKRRPGL